MRRTYSFIHEPADDFLKDLLAVSLKFCSSGLIVVRRPEDLGEKAMDFLLSLQPFVKGMEETTEWPGTRLIGHTATVHKFRFDEQTINLLLGNAPRLYDWQHPDLPEDLTLFRPDGDTWLLSIAHERDSALKLSPEEFQSLLKEKPQLAASLSLDSEPPPCPKI